MLAVFLVEFSLIPYTIFVGQAELISDGNWLIEIVIDIMHTFNMAIVICTQLKGDGAGPQKKF
jgi:hypothetical protein